KASSVFVSSVVRCMSLTSRTAESSAMQRIGGETREEEGEECVCVCVCVCERVYRGSRERERERETLGPGLLMVSVCFHDQGKDRDERDHKGLDSPSVYGTRGQAHQLHQYAM